MTSPWLTCFSLVSASTLGAATVAGQFHLTGSRLASVTKLKNYSGIVVWLEPAQGRAPLPAPSTYTVLQKGKRFSPHISIVPVGSTVEFPNLDPIFHNAFSNFAGQPFDTGLYAPGATYRVHFRRHGVVRVFCNIHSTMSAVVVVVPSPWYAASGPDGSFRIENVPSGEYSLKVFHERASDATLASLEKRITVNGNSLQLEASAISESGFLTAPHKNKFGKDYGPEPPDRVPYGAGR